MFRGNIENLGDCKEALFAVRDDAESTTSRDFCLSKLSEPYEMGLCFVEQRNVEY